MRIRHCVLCLVNNHFVRQGEIDPHQFFTRHDVTAEVRANIDMVLEHVRTMKRIIDLADCPDPGIGKYCDSPYTCPLREKCWSFLPPRNVLELVCDTKGRGFDLLDSGILRLAGIPEDFPLLSKQRIQRQVAISGKPHVDRTEIERFLSKLEYPLHFLDFETFNTAIPIFDGTWPYEQVPFQFSLHVVREPGRKAEHRKFLAEGQNDPRPEFMRQLNAAIEPTGSIVGFNAAFEQGRLEECAEALPEYADWVEMATSRIVDLMAPFRAFHFYHPNQCGSASLKYVLPVLTGKDYTSLEIQEGGMASREFLRVTFTDVDGKERERVRRALDLYCGQDTEGMIGILEFLRMQVA